MEIQKVLQLPVSFQYAIWLKIDQEFSIAEILSQIRNSLHQSEIENLRRLLSVGDIEGYATQKRNLPAVTFCGTFDVNRRKETLKLYNELIVIDIDKLDTKELHRVKVVLENDPYVFSCWISPSGHGFKGLVKLEYHCSLDEMEIDRAHKSAFAQLAAYFAREYGISLDESGCDITRLCFLSYDPNLVLKTKLQPFPVKKEDFARRYDSMPEIDIEEKRLLQHKNRAEEKLLMEDIIRYLEGAGLSITDSYEKWYRVAYGLAEAFTFKLGLSYYLTLCAMDGNYYDERASRNMFYYCYRNSTGKIKFNSVVFFAGQQGYKIVPSITKQIDENKDK